MPPTRTRVGVISTGTVPRCGMIRPDSISPLISGSSQYLMLFAGSLGRR